MIAVPLTDVKLIPYVNGELTIAAMNAPGLNVLAGSVPAIEAAQARLAANGVATVRLRTSHAFHSRLVEPVVGNFEPLCVRRIYASRVSNSFPSHRRLD